MKKEITYKSSDNITDIHGYIWDTKKPNAVVVFLHGMMEHAERYENLANELNKNNIIFTGIDILGHGKSVKSKKHYGYIAKKNPEKVLVDDLHQMILLIKDKYKDLPVILMAHSFGSFISRNYIQQYDDEINSAIFIGTGYMSKLSTSIDKNLTKLISIIHGSDYYISNYLYSKTNITMGKHFKEKDLFPACWINKNPKKLLENMNPEYSKHKFTCNAYKTMFQLIKTANSKNLSKKIRKDLKILLLSGSDDAVGNFGKDIEIIKNTYKQAGIKNVSSKIYKGMRHDILNDDDGHIVHKDIIDYINKNTKKTS